MKTNTFSLVATLLLAAPASGQVPNTVFLDELTWVEVADKIDAGTTTVIVATAGDRAERPAHGVGETQIHRGRDGRADRAGAR